MDDSAAGANFTDFLQRQNAAEARKQQKLDSARKAMTPQGKPAVNRHSQSLNQSISGTDFLQRLQKDAVRKEHETLRKKAKSNVDPNCTFRPSINRSSQNRKGRSVVELSRGDMLKKETAQRLAKLKTEQDELSGLTFQPKINRNNKSEGKIQILSNPETYLQRLQKNAKEYSEKQRRMAQSQETKEMEDCTFAPEINDAPAYVKVRAAPETFLKSARPPARLPACPPSCSCALTYRVFVAVPRAAPFAAHRAQHETDAAVAGCGQCGRGEAPVEISRPLTLLV